MEETTHANGSNKGTALAKIQPTAIATTNAYEPRNSQEAFEIAKHFAASKLLGDLNAADSVFLIMAVGAELGIPATAALRGVYVVKGRPFVSADLMKSLCLRRRDVCEFFRMVKSDDKAATYTAKRVGDDPVTMTFTIEDAARAKLATKNDDSNWSKYPAVMLRHRCTAMIAREVFPDLVMGIYCEEERADVEDDRRVIEAEVIDQTATDDLAQRIEAFGVRIDNAESLAALKEIVAEVNRDPAASEIKAQVKERYDARKAALTEAA